MLLNCPSSVHTEETPALKPAFESYGDVQRKSCLPEFKAAELIYDRLLRFSEKSYGFNLRNCRSSAWFARNTESGEVRIASKSCHLRWCPLCSASRRNYISHSVREWLDHEKYPKFLTLTLKHSKFSLESQIDLLYKSFRTLRKRSHFKNLINGGIWFFQIKKSKNDGLWHPHIHCLIGGLYIPHSWLTKQWSDITFGSTVVDIRPISDPRKAGNDAARYAAAPGSLSSLSFEDGCELVECMHGRRICGTWGTGRAVSLRPAKLSDSGTWESVGSWGTVMGLRDINQSARAIAYAYYNNKPLEAGLNLSHIDETDVAQPGFNSYECDWDKVTPDDWKPP